MYTDYKAWFLFYIKYCSSYDVCKIWHSRRFYKNEKMNTNDYLRYKWSFDGEIEIQILPAYITNVRFVRIIKIRKHAIVLRLFGLHRYEK